MKIEAGNNVFVLGFNGKVNEEEKVFLETAKQMIDKRLGVELSEGITETEQLAVMAVNEKRESQSTVAPRTSQELRQTRQKFNSVKEYLESQERRLIVGECECEKVYHFWVDDPNQKEFKFTCNRCEEEKVINMNDLVPATYKCSECGKQSSFWMEPSQAVAIDCIGCRAEIDMYYHDKKKIMTNE